MPYKPQIHNTLNTHSNSNSNSHSHYSRGARLSLPRGTPDSHTHTHMQCHNSHAQPHARHTPLTPLATQAKPTRTTHHTPHTTHHTHLTPGVTPHTTHHTPRRRRTAPRAYRIRIPRTPCTAQAQQVTTQHGVAARHPTQLTCHCHLPCTEGLLVSSVWCYGNRGPID
jgi:hypothetical protein